ncbi:hypothetical protein FNL55_07385 [Tardiphaga sp. vice352]|uniref:hypothetical protein n=1 Tax=unclassified Tardiphaga TaxID=2631404 RepID=UPI0011642010|nr:MULTISPECIES: hypothetical protein [unclassified Tardiphaga]QDM15804.1 hypothetical protein FNL53_07675 [Tardiphaga sp. vice278]QDM20905.1 hypothetical protein FIU28_07040 [Tardiphaga sp. vice154]QDM25999.1 hypothetical protein FNL56_07730 [Tardiphaga sp. vice304]QDM31146.1 hypothetical protein FNL55_07385 [Tardiphaga sp. vice352]
MTKREPAPMVSYVTEIHKDGGRRGITTHAGPLEKAKVEAAEALRQHRAEFVLVIDLDNFAEV